MLSIVSVGLSMFVADCVHTDSLIFSHNFTQASLIASASNSAKLYLFMSLQVLACLVMFPFIANMMNGTSMFSLECASFEILLPFKSVRVTYGLFGNFAVRFGDVCFGQA